MSKVEQRRSNRRMPGKRQAGCFFLGYFSFTSGMLPCALRVSCAVLARSRVQRGRAKEKCFGPRSDSKSLLLESRGRRSGEVPPAPQAPAPHPSPLPDGERELWCPSNDHSVWPISDYRQLLADSKL